MVRRDRVILEKILSEIDVADSMMEGNNFDDFDENEMLKRAICMTVINVGELVKSLTVEVRREHSGIPWKEIAGFRDIAAHKYQTLNMNDVYETVTTDFRTLSEQICKILYEN